MANLYNPDFDGLNWQLGTMLHDLIYVAAVVLTIANVLVWLANRK